MDTCRSVVVRCADPSRPPTIPRGAPIRVGTVVGDCEVSICVPSECAPDVGTRMYFSRFYRYSIEVSEDDVLIYEQSGSRSKLYVYPKEVWDKVYKLYVAPLRSGEPVKEHLLLIGAPGTGKSAMARLVANMLGVNVYEVAPDEVKSKWYGESEKRLRSLLEEAASAEPSVVIIDDAEFLITARQTTVSHSSGAEATELSLRNILFGFLQSVIDEGRMVLVIATTNFSPSALDQALMRGARFGEPVFIHLPSFNALYRYALHRLGNEEKAKELAYKCVSRGLTIADLESMIKYMSLGLEPEFKRLGGRGYSRLHAAPVKEIVESRKLRDEIGRLFSLEKGRYTTLWFDVPSVVGLPILAQVLMCLRRPGMVVTDYRYVDEFAFSVDTMKAVAVVPTHLPPDVQTYVRMNCSQPIIYVGKEPPHVEAYAPFLSLSDMYRLLDERVAPLLRAVAAYYGIKLTPDDERMAERLVAGRKVKVVDLLVAAGTCGTVNEEVFARVLASH